MKIWQSTRNVKSLFYLSFTLLALLLSSFHKSNTYPHPIVPNKEKFVVELDAGHGGHDPGNLGNGYLEKSIALNIVLKVGEMLEANPDIEVVYTRKDDTFVDLYVRGEIANKANADLFVSVHCDSHTSNAHGAGTFVLGLHANKQNFAIAKKENSVIYLEDDYATRYAEYDINSPESVIGLTIMQEEFLDQSILLAKMMQDNFTKDLKRNDRKVKQAGFIVLHQTFMPSILVETGFLTNTEEGAYLNSKQGQSEMGKAIAEAILDYKKNIAAGVAPEETPQEKSSSTPEVPAVPDKKEEVVEVVKAEEPTTVVEKPAKVVVNKEEKEEVVKEVEEKIPAVSKPKEVVETPEPVEKPVVESKPEVKEPVPTERGSCQARSSKRRNS